LLPFLSLREYPISSLVRQVEPDSVFWQLILTDIYIT
jgi:hypothetical protein